MTRGKVYRFGSSPWGELASDDRYSFLSLSTNIRLPEYRTFSGAVQLGDHNRSLGAGLGYDLATTIG